MVLGSGFFVQPSFLQSARIPARKSTGRCGPMHLIKFRPHGGGGGGRNDRCHGRVRPGSQTDTCAPLRMSMSTVPSGTSAFRNSTRELASTTILGSRSKRESNYHNQTVIVVLQSSADELRRANIPEPEASACQLLATVLNLSWESGHRDLAVLLNNPSTGRSHGHKPTTSDPLSCRTLCVDEATRYADLMERRLCHEPIQYLVGQWDFLDYTFRIRAPLLCPRAETEELVLHAEHDIRAAASTDDPQTIRVLDVGCGTGCVGVSLLERLVSNKHPAIRGIHMEAIDVERTAVEVSLKNARRILERHDVLVAAEEQATDAGSASCSYTARLCDLQHFDPSHRFHLVVSNPPYIPLTDRDTLDANVRDFESPTALFGGHDGMDVIRDLVLKLPIWCHSNAVCWMEVDPSHPELLVEWIDEQEASLRKAVVFDEFRCDMFGRKRFVRLRVNPTD